jgi:hypothetical protein
MDSISTYQDRVCQDDDELTNFSEVKAFSTISGLESEVDEWDGIRKLDLLRKMEEQKLREEEILLSKIKLREELDRQNQQLRDRKKYSDM